MFQIEAAGLVIRIDNRFEHVRRMCRDYLTSPDRPADITVSVSEEELRAEIEKAPECFFESGYNESVVLYEKISNALPAYDAFVMHSSVVAVDGAAYAFAAESGTGKSTHTRYWKEVLGNRLTVINGDKPIYRFVDGTLLAFGTPWCGKENWHTRASAPLKALCLLERSEENAVFPVDAFEMIGELLRHFHLPGGGAVDIQKLIELIDRMVTQVPVYRLRCRNDRSAAEAVWGTAAVPAARKEAAAVLESSDLSWYCFWAAVAAWERFLEVVAVLRMAGHPPAARRAAAPAGI